MSNKDVIIGMKEKEGKLRFELIPPEMKLALAEVLTYGANKYADNNWKYVPIQEYIGAMERHINKWELGEEINAESGLHHLKHALTNLMFICYLADKNITKENISNETSNTTRT